MACIDIEEMQFYAFHGCFAEERKIGTNFSVDLHLEVETSKAQVTDDINDTVNYLSVYQSVKRQMFIPSNLLENVASRIVDTLLEEFPAIEMARVKVTKLNPPLGGKMRGVSLTVEKRR